METEMREIRKRCVGATGDAAVSPANLPALNSTDAIQISTAKITEGIQKLMAFTT